MRAFAEGCGGQMIIVREPVPDWNAPDHAVYGMWRVQMELVRKFRRDGRPFWYIDNGWFRNIGEREIERRWYRVTRNGMAPRFLPGRSMERAESFFPTDKLENVTRETIHTNPELFALWDRASKEPLVLQELSRRFD